MTRVDGSRSTKHGMEWNTTQTHHTGNIILVVELPAGRSIVERSLSLSFFPGSAVLNDDDGAPNENQQ